MASRRKTRKKITPKPTTKGPEPRLFSPETEAKMKRAADSVLGAIEADPERAFEGLAKIGDQLERTAQYFRENPEEAKRMAKNTALAGLAKALRKAL